MSEKKVMIINCDVCDARKAKEEDLSGYEHILINTDLLLVTQESKGLLERLPVMCNTDNMVELEGDANVIVQNENYVIGGAAAVPENSVLAVNRDLEIRPDAARETLENFRQSLSMGIFFPRFHWLDACKILLSMEAWRLIRMTALFWRLYSCRIVISI